MSYISCFTDKNRYYKSSAATDMYTLCVSKPGYANMFYASHPAFMPWYPLDTGMTFFLQTSFHSKHKTRNKPKPKKTNTTTTTKESQMRKFSLTNASSYCGYNHLKLHANFPKRTSSKFLRIRANWKFRHGSSEIRSLVPHETTQTNSVETSRNVTWAKCSHIHSGLRIIREKKPGLAIPV